jgi:hypothetical protein
LSWRPVAPDALPDRIADWLAATPAVLRVAIDGDPATAPDDFAVSLIEPLRLLGRPAVCVRAADFLRDASLRLEHGRQDVESYLSWVDTDALRREVLVPAVEEARYLPTLRDPRTNRSTREPARPLPSDAVVLVSGSLLLGAGLPFDRVVHLALSPAARRRRMPADEQWTLPAHEQYDRTVGPVDLADVVVKLDDPRHPAVRWPESLT